MPLDELVGLEHAVALGDREHTAIKRQLQRPLRRLAACPQMLLVHQHVVLDVADGECSALPDQAHYLAHVLGFHRRKPSVAFAAMASHGGNEEAQIAGRHIGQCVGPVFEHAFVGALGMAQIGAGIGRNPVPENVMVTALDHVDGIDLHIAEVFDRCGRRLRPLAEWRLGVEPLRAQPDLPGCSLVQGSGFGDVQHRAAMYPDSSISKMHSRKNDQSRTTILPPASFDSISLWALRIYSKRKTFAGPALQAPAATRNQTAELTALPYLRWCRSRSPPRTPPCRVPAPCTCKRYR